MSFKTLAKVGLIAGAVIGAVVAAEATDISGAGATFPYPIYSNGLRPIRPKPAIA